MLKDKTNISFIAYLREGDFKRGLLIKKIRRSNESIDINAPI